jgi:CRP-like cAMP-binding protein
MRSLFLLLSAEISFLEGTKASASVVAAEDGTEVYIMSKKNLQLLFFCKPPLAGRFYQFLATTLSGRLKDREMTLQ